MRYNKKTKWEVLFHETFESELLELAEEVKTGLASSAKMLQEFGPQLGRPHVDTLRGSDYTNMKELRFNANDGVWRVAFAFDQKRKAILLVAGDKSGDNQKRFYKQLIKKADERFKDWIKNQKG